MFFYAIGVMLRPHIEVMAKVVPIKFGQSSPVIPLALALGVTLGLSEILIRT